VQHFCKFFLPFLFCVSVVCNAATISWDSFSVTIDASTGTPTSAIVDVVNVHWTGVAPVPTSAQLQDLAYGSTFYFFSGVQQSSDGTVTPNEQAFFTFDPTLAAEILEAYQDENLYIGLFSGPTFLVGDHAHSENSTLSVITPEPWLVWPTGLALAAFLLRRKR